MDSKHLVKSSFIALAFLCLPLSLEAKDYPGQAIQGYFGFAAGNPSFALGQMIFERVGKIVGGKIVPSAMPGAGGVKAVRYVLSKPADGYTLYNARVADQVMAVLTRPDIGYSYQDFDPICKAATVPFTIVVPKSSPWENLEQFVAHARENPGMKYACLPDWSVPHALMAAFLAVHPT